MDKVTIKNNELYRVALFGRTNVGKSSLFNRLTGNSKAMVSNLAGTTRDANFGVVDWQGQKFELADTGGIIDLDKLFIKKVITNDIDVQVQRQIKSVLKKAHLILFVVDAKQGYNEEDKKVVLVLKKVFRDLNKIILVVNKADNAKDRMNATDFYKLAVGEPQMVSAHTGSGTGDLLEEVIKRLDYSLVEEKIKETDMANEDEEAEEDALGEESEAGEDKEVSQSHRYKDKVSLDINVCILGKPNAGKSSLMNTILGTERVIVSDIPHTTRESQDSIVDYEGKKITFVDTAGFSRQEHRIVKQKKSRIHPEELKTENDLFMLGMASSLTALKRADIAIFVIDITQDITLEESKILEEIGKKKKSIIILANKWDKVDDKDTKKYTEYIYNNFPFIAWAPIHFASAKTGLKVDKLLDLILEIDKARRTQLSDSVLNKFLVDIVKIHKPAKAKGVKHPRIYELSQSGTCPPDFKIRIGNKDTLHFSYLHFIQNRLRDKYGFKGTPISMWVKKGR